MIRPMRKLWQFIQSKFLTKQFLIFGIVGVVNTLIHMVVYWLMYNPLQLGAFVSNTVAFVAASVFSYFANAFLTFKPTNRNKTQFAIVMGVFLARLLVSDGLTVAFDYIVQNWMHLDYELNKLYSLIPTFIASVLLIPIAYFALAFVFRKTDSATIR